MAGLTNLFIGTLIWGTSAAIVLGILFVSIGPDNFILAAWAFLFSYAAATYILVALVLKGRHRNVWERLAEDH